jgi:hypothetical protein
MQRAGDGRPRSFAALNDRRFPAVTTFRASRQPRSTTSSEILRTSAVPAVAFPIGPGREKISRRC